MHRDLVFDDEPVTRGDAAIIRGATERRCQRGALRSRIGEDRDDAPVDANDEAAPALGRGLGEGRFEGAVPP